MRRSNWRFAVWAAALLAAQGTLVAADAPARKPAAVRPKSDKESSAFLRLRRDKSNMPLALETSIVRYAVPGDPDSPTVDLVAAVHIADAGYYKQLNREFAGYDAVLYELVAPENANTPKPNDSPGHHPISLLQNGMKDILALEYQLKGIDYTAKNMVHADMSPEQFARSMEQRGESLWGMCARMMGYALTQQGHGADGLSNAQMLELLFDKNRTLSLKRVVSEQFAQGDGATAALEGPKGSTLIGGRNQVALKVLRRELAAGKRKVAIFYGAAHMPDFQKRLRDDFKMTPSDARWLTAWDMTDKPAVKKGSAIRD